jgi:two-component system, response regulator PdtaR
MDPKDNHAKPVVLIAEDEPLLRLHASDLLEERGYEVVEAEDAAAALRVMENRPDVRLLFTDIQMPGRFDGMDLARQVHARWPHVLLVITSGRLRPRTEEIPDHGRFVAKPYGASELLSQIDDLMNKGVR